ncbi:hexose transporter protein [Diplodia corticola]|uniref:Hexose transporter protein n=1 Tax=Diplodia corticola TaxID=236234 RepID=A0A1J9REQ7_9PEZI|nr:hexose transporter protein [Diplodia corticola]OJD39032.1 hexose transporter protein [Diplodia corticola]
MADSKRVTVDEEKLPDEERAPKIEIPELTWWRDPGLRKLYCMMPILFLGSTINGYDGSLLNGLQTMDPWQEYFDHPTSARLGLFTAIQNIGSFVALFFSSYAADMLGRKIGVVIGLIVLLVGTVIQVVPSVNSGMFIGGRFLVGFGSNLSQGSAPLLVMELAYPTHRGKLTTMYNTLWYVGSIVAAWTVYGTVKYTSDAAWRIPVGVQAAMPVMQLIGIWFLPESPRWLCAKDRTSEAFEVLSKYHANGDTHSVFIEQELSEIQETIRLEQQSAQNGWADLVRTPGNRKRVLLILLTAFFSQCSGNGLVSYYIHDILTSVGVRDAGDQSVINGGLQVWSFLVAVGFSVLLVDRLGRRTLFMTAAVGMLVTFSVWTACSAVYAETSGTNTSAGRAVIAMIFLFYTAAGFAWPGLTVAYCAEILPFPIRARGLALAMAATAASSVLNQYVNPVGLAAWRWRFYLVYVVVLLFECVAVWGLYVETGGSRTLEGVAGLFDGVEAGGKGAGKREEREGKREEGKEGRGGVEHVEEAVEGKVEGGQ